MYYNQRSGFGEILQDAGLYGETQVEGNFFPISLG